MSKNKGTQSGAIKAKVKELEERFKNTAERLVKESQALRKEVAGSVGDLQERFKKIVIATGQQLAQLQANSQVHSNVLEQLDINVQAVAKMHLEAFGRFEQIQSYLVRSGIAAEELTQEELAEIKDKAKEAYEATMTECFRQVHEERKAAVEEQRKAADEAKVAEAKAVEEAAVAKKEAVDKSESEFAEEALQDAESRNLSASVGGQGASIPAGADVFGG